MKKSIGLFASLCFFACIHESAFGVGSLPSLEGAKLTCSYGTYIYKLSIEEKIAATALADNSYSGTFERQSPQQSTENVQIDQHTIRTRCEVGWSLTVAVSGGVSGGKLKFSTIEFNPCEGGKIGNEATLTEVLCRRDEEACREIVRPLACSLVIPSE